MTTHMFLTQYNSQTAGFKQIGLGEEQLFPSSANKTVYFLRRPNLTCRKLGEKQNEAFPARCSELVVR